MFRFPIAAGLAGWLLLVSTGQLVAQSTTPAGGATGSRAEAVRAERLKERNRLWDEAQELRSVGKLAEALVVLTIHVPGPEITPMPVHVPTVAEVKAEYEKVLKLQAWTPPVEVEYLKIKGSTRFQPAWVGGGFYHNIVNSTNGTVIRYSGSVFIEKNVDSQLVEIRQELERLRVFFTNIANGRDTKLYLDWEDDKPTFDGHHWMFTIRGIIKN